MRFSNALAVLWTRDVEESLAFYAGLLGCSAGYRWPQEGRPEFVVLHLGDSAFAVADASATERLLGVTMADGARFELCVFTPDVHEAVVGLRAAGVRVLREPAEMPWGEQLAYVADPDGNPVQVASATGSASA